MTQLTNYVLRKIQFKLIDYKTQIFKDRLHSVSKSMLVLQKDNLTESEFVDFQKEIIDNLNKKYTVKKVSLKITKFHEILVVEDT